MQTKKRCFHPWPEFEDETADREGKREVIKSKSKSNRENMVVNLNFHYIISDIWQARKINELLLLVSVRWVSYCFIAFRI